MEAQFKIFGLKRLMKLSGLSGFRLQYKIFFDQGLNLFFCCNFSDILSDVNERFIELEFVIKQFWQNELHLRIELSYLQTLQVFLLELTHHVCIVGNHGLQKPT